VEVEKFVNISDTGQVAKNAEAVDYVIMVYPDIPVKGVEVVEFVHTVNNDLAVSCVEEAIYVSQNGALQENDGRVMSTYFRIKTNQETTKPRNTVSSNSSKINSHD
jgi:hypothetical protein